MGQAVKEFQKAKDEFSDELHNAGKTDPAKPDVRAAQATVTANRKCTAWQSDSATQPDPNQTTAPGDKANQV